MTKTTVANMDSTFCYLITIKDFSGAECCSRLVSREIVLYRLELLGRASSRAIFGLCFLRQVLTKPDHTSVWAVAKLLKVNFNSKRTKMPIKAKLLKQISRYSNNCRLLSSAQEYHFMEVGLNGAVYLAFFKLFSRIFVVVIIAT